MFKSTLVKHLSAQRDRSSRHLIDLLRPSMKRTALRLFLTISEMRSFKVLFVSIVVTSWPFIESLFLNFHIAHIVRVIKMRILSESFTLCSSILANKVDPLRLVTRVYQPQSFLQSRNPTGEVQFVIFWVGDSRCRRGGYRWEALAAIGRGHGWEVQNVSGSDWW